MSQTFISCLHWVERGYAAAVPREIEMTEEEVMALKQDPMIAQQMDDMPHFCEDIMVSGPSPYPTAIQDISDEEQDDYHIRETDALIIAGKVEKEHASLQIYVYEASANNMYVHHEIMMSSFPLDIEWLRVNLGSINDPEPVKGNYAIVSSFLPEIEVWNLDLVQALQPQLLLGGQIQSKKRPKKFSNKTKKYKEGSHTDSILSLSLNRANLNILGSGSVDQTVKIWDISHNKNIMSLDVHSGPVSTIQWSASDPSVLLSCSSHIVVNDSRYPDDNIKIATHGNIERYTDVVCSACWNPSTPSQIGYVTSEGQLHLVDIRQPTKGLLMQQVHAAAANDIVIIDKQLCLTCSEDEYVRVWSLLDLSAPLAAKNPKCGKLLCMDMLGEVVGVGNDKGELFVWDLAENQQIRDYLQSH